MDTSKFAEIESEFVAQAIVFSGRQNPIWPVDIRVGRQLEVLWGMLETQIGSFSQSVGLGYRGCFLRHQPGCTWFAFQGVVLREREHEKEIRIDQKREFEKLLLSSAPQGLLPITFLPHELVR